MEMRLLYRCEATAAIESSWRNNIVYAQKNPNGFGLLSLS
jgi:hypothetical protein